MITSPDQVCVCVCVCVCGCLNCYDEKLEQPSTDTLLIILGKD